MREQGRRSEVGTEVFLSTALRGPHPSGVSLREGCWCGFQFLWVRTSHGGWVRTLWAWEQRRGGMNYAQDRWCGSFRWSLLWLVDAILMPGFWLDGKWALTWAGLSLLVCIYHMHHLLHIQHVLGPLLSALHLILPATLWGSSYNYFHFMAKETEAQKGPITCLRCHS